MLHTERERPLSILSLELQEQSAPLSLSRRVVVLEPCKEWKLELKTHDRKGNPETTLREVKVVRREVVIVVSTQRNRRHPAQLGELDTLVRYLLL